MNCKIRQFAVGGLALWLVALSGVVYPQLSAHSTQHAHHDASTHATVLCSWLCMAADAGEEASLHFAPVEQIAFIEQKFFVPQISAVGTVHPPSRAPPFA